MKKGVVFLIDDDVDLLASATDWIEMNGFEVAAFSNAIDAIRQLDNVVPDVLVSDIRMPSVDGMTLLATVRKSHPAVPVVLLTGHGEVQLAVKAMKAGAEDFLEKPYDADHLIAVLEKAVKRHALSAEIGRLQKVVRRVSNDTEEIIGSHPSMIRLREQVRTIAALDVDVLVIGETGTGKELVARTLHEQSARASRPFVPINCAAIPEAAFESELFGYAKGAFPGADKDRAGKFEYASGGTILLDEADALPLPLQAKLLRVLQERTIERLGENRSRPVDVRVLATSKTDLQEAIRQNRFRSDLYFRLSATTIPLPPLRSRDNDILLLYAHFARLAAQRYGVSPARLEPEAGYQLLKEDWPGNVRELKNRAEAEALGLDWIQGSDLSPDKNTEFLAGLNDELKHYERTLIQRALATSGNNIAKAAAILRIPRRTLSEKISRLGL
ncbi:MAG: sigma-54-dependent Fis family transcriptional regulator [Nitratireductor sp.]|nr:sigma-54-dependent Fis family transcriptional regulator [Nitratireductor sp.]